jgi:hypothetical protein
MKIDRSTYELYVIDYLDGKLDAVRVSELLLFLEQNPDLKEEFDGLETFNISPENETVPDFNGLKKPIYQEVKQSYNHLLIGELEGDLTAQEEQQLQQTLQLYPELEIDQTLYALTKLTPDATQVFGDKAKLKKRAPVIIPLLKWSAVAASLFITSVIGWYALDTNPTQNSLVVNEHVLNDTQVNQPLIQPKAQTGSSLFVESHHTQQTALAQLPEKTYIQKVVVSAPVIDTKPITSLYNTNASPINENGVNVEFLFVNRPAVINEADEFMPLKTWVINKVKKKMHLDEKNMLATLNKVMPTELVVEKDETSGKLTRIEFAGLSIEYSK